MINASARAVPELGDVNYQHMGFSGAAGLRALVLNSTNIYTSWSQGFRSPNLQETTVLGDTGNFFEIPNDELGPERSDTIEVGVRAQKRRIRGSAAVFKTWLSDAIVREPSTWEGAETVDGDLEVRRRINADSATYQGIEGALEIETIANVSVFGSGAWIQGDVETEDGAEQPGRRIPPLTWTGGFKWRSEARMLTGRLFARGAAAQDRLNADDRKDLRICRDPSNPAESLGDACTGTPAWWTLNASASLKLPWLEDSTVRLNLENILDVNYRQHGSGFDGPGFNARVGATLGF